MITMPIPPAELYPAMERASAKAAMAAGNAINNVQQGFLSCVTKVYNSLVTMKNAVVAGFHRLSERWRPSATEASLTKLNPISGADTRIFCQELIRKMEADPGSINGMFRKSPRIKLSEFNQRLTDQTAFLDAIKSDKVNNVEAGELIKKWMAQMLEDNKFSPEERRALVASKNSRDEVNKIFENKFNSSDANGRENRDKFISLLSVMRSYKKISLANINMENREHDPSVVGVMGAPTIFDFDLCATTNPAEIVMYAKAMNESVTAFTALLDHCPPDVAPRRVFMHSNSMKDAGIAGFHSLSERMSPSATEAPVTKLNPISAVDTRIFCQELIRKMKADPGSINGMFRKSPRIKLSEFNQRLTDQTTFLDAIKSDEVNNVEAGELIKKWMAQILEDNKFSPEERRALVAIKNNRAEVNKIFENKFNSSDANGRENRDKFISLLSVMRSYKEISLANINMENREHDPSVVGVMGVPTIFDFDLCAKAIDESVTAFTALLDHCPPGVPPKPVFMRSN